MKEKFLRYLSIFLYEAYIVCLFLPIKFTFGAKTDVYGLNVLYAILMEEKLPITFLISLLFLVFPLWGLITALKDLKKESAYYIGFSLGFVHCIFYIISAVFRFGQGFGIGVCAVISLILCVFNAIKIFSVSNTAQEKPYIQIHDNNVFDSMNNFDENKVHNCPYCDKPLSDNEECNCQKAVF